MTAFVEHVVLFLGYSVNGECTGNPGVKARELVLPDLVELLREREWTLGESVTASRVAGVPARSMQ